MNYSPLSGPLPAPPRPRRVARAAGTNYRPPEHHSTQGDVRGWAGAPRGGVRPRASAGLHARSRCFWPSIKDNRASALVWAGAGHAADGIGRVEAPPAARREGKVVRRRAGRIGVGLAGPEAGRPEGAGPTRVRFRPRLSHRKWSDTVLQEPDGPLQPRYWRVNAVLARPYAGRLRAGPGRPREAAIKKRLPGSSATRGYTARWPRGASAKASASSRPGGRADTMAATRAGECRNANNCLIFARRAQRGPGWPAGPEWSEEAGQAGKPEGLPMTRRAVPALPLPAPWWAECLCPEPWWSPCPEPAAPAGR